MDISKAFDCVPHDLLLAKLAVYGVDESFLCYIYSYLLNASQEYHSDFLSVVSDAPQGSIVGPILFNCFFNDFLYITRFYFYKNIEIGESHAIFLTCSILRLKMFLTCSYFLAFQKPLFFQLLRKG